jgi:putative transcriptional regulator
MKTKSKSLGATIIARLQRFNDVLESGEPIERHLRVTKVPVLKTRMTPADVKGIRTSLGVSQVNFGHFLGVSEKTIQGWEQGITKPSGMARRFLDEIRHDPHYWGQRLKQLATNGAD